MRFTKMEGLGNDYIYINNLEEQIPEEDLPDLSRAVSDRHFGIGADGLIAILPSDSEDFRFRMFNADGSEGEMCGNGIRCFAKYVYTNGLSDKTTLRIETKAGTIVPHLVVEDGEVTGVRVDMGKPRFRRSEIPMAGDDQDRVIGESLEAGDRRYTFTAVSMGNPHCVVFCDDVDQVDLEFIGPKIEHHPLFPRRVNVHFVQILGPGEIKMRTWERGSGITLACGTGACACLIASAVNGLTGRKANVHLPGGDLLVEWAEDGRVLMTGPADEVCRGEFTRKWK